ncbi:MAG TPA: (2Fe-2S)-binding protein [Candidatus Ozemobacteraceae bacterium]|nr:(2Fe-2S)-binding protein [Candidatus Ozemobacteraceae bacterium]
MTAQGVPVKCKVNGSMIEIQIPATRTLLEMLRRDLALTGAKEGCGKGECGACTVLLNGQPVNSCLKLAATLLPSDEVETIEGLADDSLMKKLQQSYVDTGAVQCGFCTPGMVMSSYALLRRVARPTLDQIKEAHAGNLCRCTGYRKIFDAVQQAAEKGDRA